jgi:hypothetical protein
VFRHIHHVFHARIYRFNEITNGHCFLAIFVQKHIEINIIVGVIRRVIRRIIGGVIGSIMNYAILFRT